MHKKQSPWSHNSLTSTAINHCYDFVKLEVEFNHHIDSVVSNPLKVILGKCICIEPAILIVAILHGCPLVLETDVHLTYIIYKLRVDAVYLVEIRESVAAEIDIILYKRVSSLCQAKVP